MTIKSYDDILPDVELAQSLNAEIIKSVETQGVVNAQIFYSLRDGLAELHSFIVNQKPPDETFFERWRRLWGWLSRSLEGTDLLDILVKIDMFISK